jgi:hypothetical protein
MKNKQSFRCIVVPKQCKRFNGIVFETLNDKVNILIKKGVIEEIKDKWNIIFLD